ncbi:MAG: hypothetical protein RLZZ476_776 [Verrucomicrobiota bacterium]|jgi:hypothetical protein
MLFIKAIMLAALIRLLLATSKPILCSGIYTAVSVFFGLALGTKFLTVLVSGAIVFGLTSLYFTLLDRFEDSAGLFWFIAVLGIFIGMV